MPGVFNRPKLTGNPGVLTKGMDNVFRIAFAKMQVLLRLAIVASLTQYTVPSASYAMYGDASAAYLTQIPDDHVAVDVGAADHHDHDMAGSVTKNDDKPLKQDCCSDFCVSLAIIESAPEFWRAVPQSIRRFDNDSSVFGQLTSLHRPPSILA